MGIGIYKEANTGTLYSQESEYSKPVSFTADGRTGQVIERRLYVHNDDPDLAYSAITIQPYEDADPSHVDGTDGFAVKVKPGDLQPTQSGWDTVEAGEAEVFGAGIMLSGVAGLSTYLPFWSRVEVPAGEAVRTIPNIKLRLAYNVDTI